MVRPFPAPSPAVSDHLRFLTAPDSSASTVFSSAVSRPALDPPPQFVVSRRVVPRELSVLSDTSVLQLAASSVFGANCITAPTVRVFLPCPLSEVLAT